MAACQLDPTFQAIDHVQLQDHDSSAWAERLAVLTADTLYFLELGNQDPLCPFGPACGRVALKDLTVQLVTANEPTLLLTSSGIFQRDVNLRAAARGFDMHRWLYTLQAAVEREAALNLDGEVITTTLNGAAATDELQPDSEEREARERAKSSDQEREDAMLGFVAAADWVGDEANERPPWRAEALSDVLAMGLLERRHDGLIGRWGRWVERYFVLLSSGRLLYYMRAEDMMLGELRGVCELRDATIERVPQDADPREKAPCLPGHAAAESTRFSPPSLTCLRITASIEPEPQPFYELPRRCASLDLRADVRPPRRVLLAAAQCRC